jgi:hypothetical protein
LDFLKIWNEVMIFFYPIVPGIHALLEQLDCVLSRHLSSLIVKSYV